MSVFSKYLQKQGVSSQELNPEEPLMLRLHHKADLRNKILKAQKHRLVPRTEQDEIEAKERVGWSAVVVAEVVSARLFPQGPGNPAKICPFSEMDTTQCSKHHLSVWHHQAFQAANYLSGSYCVIIKQPFDHSLASVAFPHCVEMSRAEDTRPHLLSSLQRCSWEMSVSWTVQLCPFL